VSTHRLVRALVAVAAALALVGAGCGSSDDASRSPESETTKAAAVDSAQTYRDQLADIVSGPDDARGSYHDAPPGELTTVASARKLARASRTAALKIEELTPPAGLNDLHSDLAEKYRRWEAALDREVLRRPVSTARIGDVVREYGKAADDVYEQILIAP
jgi:hypothetical protein